MPSEVMEFTVTADDRPATSALDRVRSGLTSIERAAVDGARRASNALDSFARGVVKIGEVAGALYVAKKAFSEYVTSSDAAAAANSRASRATEATIDGLRALRVSYAAATGSRVALLSAVSTVGAGIAIEEAIRIAKRYGNELVAISTQAATTRKDLTETFQFAKADRLLGGNQLTPLVGKLDILTVRQYVDEIGKIQDPYLRARRAVELFGNEASTGLSLLEKPTRGAIDTAIELSLALDGKTRAAIENFRSALDGAGGIIDQAKYKLRQLSEQAKQGITVTVALAFTSAQQGVIDFLNRGGPSGPLGPRGAAAPPIPSLADIVRGAVTKAPGDLDVFPKDGRDPRFVATNAAEKALVAEGRQAQEAVRSFNQTIDGLRGQLSEARKRRDQLFATIQQGGPNASLFAPGALTAATEVSALEKRIDGLQKIEEAERRTKDLLEEAQLAEVKGIDLIEAKRVRLLQVYGLTADQIARINEQARILTDIEVRKLNESFPASLLANFKKAREENNAAAFQSNTQDLAFQENTRRESQATVRSAFEFEQTLSEQAKDAELRRLETFNTRSIQAKIAVEQAKAQIEERYLLKSFALKAELLRRDQEQAIIDMEAIAKAQGATDASIEARRTAIITQFGERGRQLTEQQQNAIDATRENAAIRISNDIRDNNQRIFDGIKRSVDGLSDALVARSKSLGQILKDSILLPLLAIPKAIASNAIAGAFTQLLGGGGGVTGGRGQNILSQLAGVGGGGASGASLPGLLGLGIGGFGSPGAPGGTSGFAGPVQSLGGVGGLSGLAGLKGASGVSGAAGLGALGIGASALGLLGAFKSGQSGNSVLRALSPGIGAVSGLVGFGALTSLFPSLIGAGPIGWIAAAGIGASIGIIGLLKDSAEKKIQDRVKSIYGIDITRNFAKDPLAGIIKQNFGGNIDVGLRSPQVKDLLELYAMSTGQNATGINPRPTAVSFGLNGNGSYTPSPIYQNGVQIPIDRIPVGTPASSTGQVVIQLDGPQTTALLRGEAVVAMQENPRTVAAAVGVAYAQSASRAQNTRAQLRPGLTTS